MSRLLLLFTLALLPFLSYADGYYFDRYHVDVTVHADHSMSVHESIDAVYTLSSHGFFRTIPTTVWIKRDVSEAQDGSTSKILSYEADIDDISTSCDSKVFSVNGVKDIRLGSPDFEVEGPQHYDLSYTMTLPSDRVPVGDIFFHSLLGTSNECATNQFSFSVHFDKEVPESYQKKLEVYAGYEGDAQDYSQVILTSRRPDLLEGRINNLKPYQGVTVYLPLPEGYFEVKTPWQTYMAWLFIALTAAVMIYVLSKEFFRNDTVSPVVSFYPPKTISSADVGTLVDCEVDDEDIISLIPWFANNGNLRIDQKGKNHAVLTFLNELPDDAPRYQKTFFHGIFHGNTTFDTSQPSSQSFGKAWLDTEQQINEHFSKRLNTADHHTFFILLIGIVLCAFAIGTATTVPDNGFMGLLFGLCFLIETSFMFIGYATKERYATLFVTIPIVIVPFFLISSFCPEPLHEGLYLFMQELPILGDFLPYYGIYNEDTMLDLYIPLWALYGVLALTFAACLFSLRLGTMTDYRRQRIGEILGLREFIRTADADRLKMLLDEDEKYFYKVLPFAMAFGMADKWAQKFQHLKLTPNENYATSSYLSLGDLFSCFTSPTVRHGIIAENNARQERARAAERARSGSSHSSARSYGGGSHGYSGGGFGGGGSRRW